jgi:hypothetical protein
MIRKILFSASLGSLLLAGGPGITLGGITPPQQEKQTQPATKSVTGKVTTIGDEGKSFAIEVASGGNKQTMQFVVDKNTQVEGQVKSGVVVVVDYQPMNGQNLCVRVSTQQG